MGRGASFMKGDLLTKTRKLVKGLAMPQPIWLQAMEQAPPATFPRIDGKVQRITLPEDPYIRKFFQKHPDSKHEDAIKICAFDPPPARVFGMRVLELKEQGVSEEEALAVADMEYRAEKKAKKEAYKRLKQLARLQGKRPPADPFPTAIKEIQAEEKPYVRDRFFDPKIRGILKRMKEDKIETQAKPRASCDESMGLDSIKSSAKALVKREKGREQRDSGEGTDRFKIQTHFYSTS